MTPTKPGARAISVPSSLLRAAGIFAVPWPPRAGAPPASPTFQLGAALMGSQMLTMVTLGFVLLATMVTAIVLATHRGRYDRFRDDLNPPPPAPPPPAPAPTATSH